MIEQVNGAEVIKVHPAREAGTCERGDVVWSGIESGGVTREDRRLGVRVHRGDDRRHPRVVAEAVRILLQKELSLDATPITLDLGRMCIDDAREFADRLLVATLIDEQLSLLRGTTRRRCRRDRSIHKERKDEPND